MQPTLAFAPTDDDLDEGFFDLPVITMVPPEPPAGDEPGEDEALRA